MTLYILDDAALVAGLGAGTESQRRELSRLVHDALNGGPPLHIPALCLSAAVSVRAAIGEHVAMLVTDAPAGVLEIRGLGGGQLAELVAEHPGLGYAAAHAAAEAMRDDVILITSDTKHYTGMPVNTVAL